MTNKESELELLIHMVSQAHHVAPDAVSRFVTDLNEQLDELKRERRIAEDGHGPTETEDDNRKQNNR